ncbi:MAG: methylated-DNA--[protein]-cysteine S-methyltransferase [Gemmatimonadales bacterium]
MTSNVMHRTKKRLGQFGVVTASVSLVVTTRGGVVYAIDLHGTADRGPDTSFEQQVALEITEYFDGRRRTFDFPIDLHGSPFETEVWTALQNIPYGSTVTYGELAAGLGRPGAARAVGSANGRNPIPIVVPCHRVIAAGGKLGGYGGGLTLKRQLLDLEAGQHQLPERD